MGATGGNRIFGVNDFIDIFTKIDGQIIELHKCSSDDFLGLNNDFKEYYRQSKVISKNASEIFETLTAPNSRELIVSLETLYRNLKQAQLRFSSLLDASLLHLSSLNRHIDELFLPLKNLNQDLMSIKLLSTNIKISSSALGNVDDSSVEENLLNLNAIISEFKNRGLKCEKNLSDFKEQVKSIDKHFNTLRNRNVHDLDSILNHIHYGIILFAEKHEEASRQIPLLKEQSDKTANSIAGIITNLQYHDIIRQKMEHIHDTQKKLVGELEQLGNENDEVQIQKDKLPLRVRDIAGLQSAQLIRANKEYQQAIEKITQRFIALSNDMLLIAAMCQDFSVANDNAEEYQLQRLLSKLESSADILNNFLQAGGEFTLSLESLTGSIQGFSNSMSDMESSLLLLKNSTNRASESAVPQPTSDDSLQLSLQQLQSLSSDIEQFEKTIQQVFLQIENIGHALSQINGQFKESIVESGSFTQASERMNHLILSLNQKNGRSLVLLEENLKMSQAIALSVRESLRKIRYYDFFDRVIVNIIGELNQIHTKLSSDSQISPDDKKENLEGIRKSYTMASEHEIHDKIVKNEGLTVPTSDEKAEENAEDEDNVEFF